MLPAPVAVFDFDLTLTSWDTASRYFGWLLRRSRWKLVVGAPVALLISPLAASRRTRRVLIRYGAWLATFGHDHEALRMLARQHVAQIMKRDGAIVRADARDRILDHQRRGHVVVVATGSLEILVREILDAERIADVTVVGSSMKRFLGGMVADRHCFGPQKIPMLRERGFAPPWTFAYADHEADLPLLRAGTSQFVVNPTPQAAAYLMSALGSSATVVTWR